MGEGSLIFEQGKSQLKLIEGMCTSLAVATAATEFTRQPPSASTTSVPSTHTTASSALLDAMQYQNQPLTGHLGFFNGFSDLASQRCEKLQDPSYFNLALSM